jgi:multidrug efflux system outer membrane protein
MLKFSVSLALAVMLAGCTLAPRYERPQAPTAARYPAEAGMQDPRAAPTEAVAADLGWQDFFGDPRLKQLIALALLNNRDLRVAMLNVQASRAQYQIERAGLFPLIGASASQSRSRMPVASVPGNILTDTDQVGASVQWELDFFGRLQSLKNQALYQYLATAQARKAAEILLVSEVADQYLTLRAGDEQLLVTGAALKSAQASYQLAQARFDAGTGSELDLRQAETVIDQAQANQEAQTRIRAQAENTLVLLIGQPLPTDMPSELPFDSRQLLSDVTPGLPSDLLTRRPDIVAAEETLRAANANIGAARAAFFPTISITGFGGSASSMLSGLFKAGSAAWTFIPNLSLPIFEAGANLAGLDLAHVRKDIAVAQYQKAIQTAFRDVANGLAARSTYVTQIEAQQRYTQAYRRTLELSTLRYQNGSDSYLQVLEAQNSFYSAQQVLITTQLNRWTSLIDLYQALGGGWLAHTGDAPRDAAATPAKTT